MMLLFTWARGGKFEDLHRPSTADRHNVRSHRSIFMTRKTLLLHPRLTLSLDARRDRLTVVQDLPVELPVAG